MAGPDGLQPPGSGPPREDRQDLAPDVSNRQEKQGDRDVHETYASKVSGNKNEKMKLNVLDIFLERQDNKISYNLSKEELAKLLFKKMSIDPKFFLKIDTSGFGKIQIELTNNVNLETMTHLPAFDIRKGLRTKFYRPHHRKDTLVTINWLDIETPDSLVTHVLGHFGKLKSNVQWVRFKQEEDESPLAKLLNNILSGERQIWMEIEKPIPSYAIIDGRKVKMYHPGQKRTCARCQKTAEHCPGNSNAKLCDERGGDKIKVETVWKDILKDVGFTDCLGVKEVELTEDDSNKDESDKKHEETAKEYPNCDGFLLSNLADDITDDGIKEMIENAVLNGSDEISILSAETSRSRLIKTQNKSLIHEIVKKIDNKSIKGHLIHFHPHVPATPPKPVAPAEIEDKETSNEGKTKGINQLNLQ